SRVHVPSLIEAAARVKSLFGAANRSRRKCVLCEKAPLRAPLSCRSFVGLWPLEDEGLPQNHTLFGSGLHTVLALSLSFTAQASASLTSTRSGGVLSKKFRA